MDMSTNFGYMYSINTAEQNVEYFANALMVRSEAEHTINGIRYPLEI